MGHCDRSRGVVRHFFISICVYVALHCTTGCLVMQASPFHSLLSMHSKVVLYCFFLSDALYWSDVFKTQSSLSFTGFDRLPVEYPIVPRNTNAAPAHISAFACLPYTATLSRRDTALRTVRMSVTVSEVTRPVSLFTPITQSSCVIVFRKR